jgi:hypothetical protein
MARDYLLGSAMDPNPKNKEIRTTVERRIWQRLSDAGAPSYDAQMVASGIVIDYLTTGRAESGSMITTLGGRMALPLLTQMMEENDE